MASPYLERPLRTLEQALRDCGRAREESAMIVPLPPGRAAERRRQTGTAEEQVDYLPERVGASA